MASRRNRFINKTLISYLKSAIKSNLQTASASIDRSASSSSSRFSLPTRPTSPPLSRFSLSRFSIQIVLCILIYAIVHNFVFRVNSKL
ncbi:uncharacterized protein LOC114259384 [Camellia sinensis]|uniref:uncharacterized protein LOC114259384 n=1 Tax=Camellia sinensis TaxID=4442 RepID=UPI001036A3A5|nr:uncharacterized protein LOC114259384 [Camellia sinensis]